MKKIVTQRQLAEIAVARGKVAALREQLGSIEYKLKDDETVVMMLLSDGSPVEDGKYTAALEVKTGAIRPPWKDIYLTHMEDQHDWPAKKAEEDARKGIEPSTTTSLIVAARNKVVPE